jgi:hypothetical protein
VSEVILDAGRATGDRSPDENGSVNETITPVASRQRQIETFLLEAHRLALSRLRAEPTRIEAVRQVLARWRAHSGPTRTDLYWDEWDQLLQGDIETLESRVCGADERATVLRSVSPISVLLTQQERSELLRNARQA